MCAIALSVAACDTIDVRDTSEQATASFTDTLTITTSTELRLVGINGSVVAAGDAPDGLVQIVGTRRVRSESIADARERLADIEVTIEEIGAVVAVTTTHRREPNGRAYEVDYTIFVPPSFGVDITQANGTVSVARIQSAVVIDNTNGAVDALTNGDLDIAVANGAIEADATVPSGGTINLASVNGEVSLAIPTNTSAVFAAAIVNGTIELDNLQLDEQTITANEVNGRLGAGNGTITLRVTNGGIRAIGR